jgi:hypothetical protein
MEEDTSGTNERRDRRADTRLHRLARLFDAFDAFDAFDGETLMLEKTDGPRRAPVDEARPGRSRLHRAGAAVLGAVVLAGGLIGCAGGTRPGTANGAAATTMPATPSSQVAVPPTTSLPLSTSPPPSTALLPNTSPPPSTAPPPSTSPPSASVPTVTVPTTPTPRATAPVPHRTVQSVDASADLPNGTYVDAPDGEPHYVLALSSATGGLEGSISYISMDGRTDTAVEYTGDAGPDRTVTLTTSSGQTYVGTYSLHTLNLNDCGAYLEWANPRQSRPLSCTFSYNGHIP